MGVFKTTGHHAFENTGSDNDFVNAPYHCKDNNAFLGRGYYFWDDNLSLAKYWGGKRYINRNKNYYVGEVVLQCKREEFFDLVGERLHQKFLHFAASRLSERRKDKKLWPIGKVIELLKMFNNIEGEFYNKFPFKAVRAADDSFVKSLETIEFAENKGNYADLNPCYLICVIDKKEILLAPLFIVHKSAIERTKQL